MEKKYLIIDENGEIVKSFYLTEIQLERIFEKIDDLEAMYEENIENEEDTESEDLKRLMQGRG